GRGDLFVGNVIAQQRVIDEIEGIKRRYPKNFQSGLDRSWQYRPFIEQQLAAAGLPKDLVWLAMVESLFQPTVVSRVGATGMWQFMPSTGRRYGLRIDQYVDERRDWEKATRAAIEYLQDLYDFHNGAWPLAVASYNMGEGGISRMIAMNGGERDIWRLMDNPPASDHMPEETKKFYPKLVAYAIVGSSPKAHGFQSNPVGREATTRVPINGSYSLAAIERAMVLPHGTLKRLNPALVRGVTPPKDEYAIIVPADAAPNLGTAIASLAKQPNRGVASVEGRTFHVVKKGDTIASIAKKYGVGQKEIVEANKIRLASRIPVGKKLLIPGEEPAGDEGTAPPVPADTAPGAAAEPKDAPPAPAPAKSYRVQKGDTLNKIALDNGVTVAVLQEANKLDAHARIRVGQELVIPGGAPAEERASAETVTHTVVKGETVGAIAKRYGVSTKDVIEGNDLKSNTIHVGDRLVIAKATGKPAKAKPETAVSAPKDAATEVNESYTVVAGDTLSKIAAAHGMKLEDLREANGLDAAATIKVGQKLKIRGAAPISKPADTTTDVAMTQPKAAKTAPEGKDGAPGITMHTVEKGQTLSSIAAKHGVKVSDLVAWNNLGEKTQIHIGQKLIVSAPKTAPAPTPAPDAPKSGAREGTKTVHKVTEGQSPASIAKRYGVKLADLFAWNGWGEKHVLHIGDEVIVYTK
ncbi:MAG: LysM peptidoglycan-binding domain-containing protein, partial [Candidatus Hydrogenedentes bacterium]|nr:LysM peptidoglycan-binding domain-containing protein [Candidatus Hydrogenedentota bacterium]